MVGAERSWGWNKPGLGWICLYSCTKTMVIAVRLQLGAAILRPTRRIPGPAAAQSRLRLLALIYVFFIVIVFYFDVLLVIIAVIILVPLAFYHFYFIHYLFLPPAPPPFNAPPLLRGAARGSVPREVGGAIGQEAGCDWRGLGERAWLGIREAWPRGGATL